MSKSALQLLLDNHNDMLRGQLQSQPPEVPQSDWGMGNGAVGRDLGAAGILPRDIRPPLPKIPPAPGVDLDQAWGQATAKGSRSMDQTDAILNEITSQARMVPERPPSTVPQSTRPIPYAGAMPRIFRSDAGKPGAFNMGDVPGMVQTNAEGVPLGQRMVPVEGLSRGSASIGRSTEIGPLPPSVQIPTDAGIMPPVINYGAIPDLGGAAVLRGTNEENRTLERFRTQGRTLEQQESIHNRLKEYNLAQHAADRGAQRQIDVARGTPQIQSGPGGVAAWDPTLNNGRGGVVQEVRPAAERSGAQAPDPATVRIKQIRDLTAAYRAMTPHLDPMSEWQMQAELSKEQDPAKKKAIMQKYGIGEQTDQALAILAQIGQLTAPEAAAAGAPAAPAAAAPTAAVGAPAPAPAAATPPPPGSVAEKYLRK